jgi:hypothetical protein
MNFIIDGAVFEKMMKVLSLSAGNDYRPALDFIHCVPFESWLICHTTNGNWMNVVHVKISTTGVLPVDPFILPFAKYTKTRKDRFVHVAVVDGVASFKTSAGTEMVNIPNSIDVMNMAKYMPEGEPVQTIRLNAKYLMEAAKSHSGSEFVDIEIRAEPNGVVFRSGGDVDTMVLPIRTKR